MTKLESYQLDGRFVATMFFSDIEGHPDDPPVARALEELALLLHRAQDPRRLPGKPLPRRSRQGRQRGLT